MYTAMADVYSPLPYMYPPLLDVYPAVADRHFLVERKDLYPFFVVIFLSSAFVLVAGRTVAARFRIKNLVFRDVDSSQVGNLQ